MDAFVRLRQAVPVGSESVRGSFVEKQKRPDVRLVTNQLVKRIVVNIADSVVVPMIMHALDMGVPVIMCGVAVIVAAVAVVVASVAVVVATVAVVVASMAVSMPVVMPHG
mmetsp:Transcript_25642/g.59090  ORF Transcript_25642/g.59090 Transcript_25642/m.59090 type:complete len:110 (-) Transcript_25642:124-453(-)|eukprot:CAMPEP_0114561024 /NCGR_PEP_ID=MMETSP0114-20121206/11781_1 /TAXON_ID=31324 /ORGANISM="Goniomonas sp, Strain m" /LENGTH=109 /DNA_ID=CAMNT_0001746627 /DNA_START=289 /DNA_END=618 /DNA_ORIENTATION=-